MVTSKQNSRPFNVLLQQLIRVTGTISIGALMLVSCAPQTNTASAPNQPEQSTSPQAEANPGAAPSPQASARTSDSPADMTVDPTVSTVVDNDLIVRAEQDNLFEIQAGQLATQKAANAQVKQFAQRMAQDHTRAADLLQQLASERNITLPTDAGDQNRAILARLSEVSGTEFDRAYMTEMVNSHQKDVALARNQLQQGKDQELKSLVNQKLPALEGHLQMAQRLAQQLS